MPKYDDVDENFEYLDLCNEVMPYTNWMEMIADLAGDAMIRQIDLGYTIKYVDAKIPSRFEEIIGALCNSLEFNKHLTALDFSGNHLGEFGPYPFSPHSWDYVKTLTATLIKSTITRLDLSDNMICSPSGQVYSSLSDLLHIYVAQKCTHLRLRKNELHSQAFAIIGCLFGPSSFLIELDLNHNRIGLDPFGNSNVDVVARVSNVLSQTHSLRILMLGYNFLTNDALVYISDALAKLPGLNVLDLSGNQFTDTGMDSLKEGIKGHANLRGRYGLKTLLLDGNPLGSAGLDILSQGIALNDTITTLGLNECDFRTDGMLKLLNVLRDNAVILKMETKRNRVTHDVSAECHAEIEANNCVLQLTSNAKSVDANKLSEVTRRALERKLRFIPQGVLELLHSNPTINNPMTDIQDALFLLCPPERHALLSKVNERSVTINDRLAYSGLVGQRVWANRVIFNAVMRWYRKFQFEMRLAQSVGLSRPKPKLGGKSTRKASSNNGKATPVTNSKKK